MLLILLVWGPRLSLFEMCDSGKGWIKHKWPQWVCEVSIIHWKVCAHIYRWEYSCVTPQMLPYLTDETKLTLKLFVLVETWVRQCKTQVMSQAGLTPRSLIPWINSSEVLIHMAFCVLYWNLVLSYPVPPGIWVILLSCVSTLYTLPTCYSLSNHLNYQINCCDIAMLVFS